MANFAANPIEAMKHAIGDPSNFIETMRMFQAFNKGRRVADGLGGTRLLSDLNALRLAKESSEFCVNMPLFMQEIGKMQRPDQGFSVDSFGVDTGAIKNVFGTITSGQRTRRDTFAIGDPIIADGVIRLDEIANAYWGEGLSHERKFELVVADAFFEAYKKLLDAYDRAIIDYIIAQKTVAGTFASTYAASVTELNTLNVPKADRVNASDFAFYSKVYQDAAANAYFLSGTNEAYLLSSTAEMQTRALRAGYGNNNQFNASGQGVDLQYFTTRLLDNRFDAVTEEGTSLLIAKGGIGTYEYIDPLFLPNMPSAADYRFDSMTVPTSVLAGTAAAALALPDVRVGIVMKNSVVDNSAGSTEENFYNRHIEFELYLRPISFKAISDAAGESPIVKYNYLKV